MTKATFIRTKFNWDWLPGSDVQSIIIKAGTWQYPGRHATGVTEGSTLFYKGGYEYHWLPGSYDEDLIAYL